MNKSDEWFTVTPDFVEYLKEVENPDLLSSGEMRHASPEGGADTVGYGHKLNQMEQMSGQLTSGATISEMTEKDAEEELKRDIRVAAYLSSSLLGQKWNTLPHYNKEVIVAFVFNLGPKFFFTYPKFLEAVLTDNRKVMAEEYERNYRDPITGKMIPLTERNRLFYERYLEDTDGP